MYRKNGGNLPLEERGQAIVLIALMLTVLMAFLALAVDGGNAYVHRRLAQNSSDGGALAGVLQMLQPGSSEAAVLGQIVQVAQRNGIDPTQPGNEVHAWYVDSSGTRLSNAEVGTWGYVPTNQGAAGVEVQVTTRFSAFVAQLIGQPSLSATTDSGATAVFDNTCAQNGMWANCADHIGNCYNNGLNLSGSSVTVTGGIHSNSGLHITTSSWSQTPQAAEWGTPGDCTDGNVGVCPPGYGQQVAPVPMPILFRWADFQPGAYWWNDMCQGTYGAACHYVNGDIRANDVISAGLWVVNGSINTPRYFDPAQVHYTFITQGNISFNNAMPAWQSFVGSSAQDGSKVFMFSLAQDPGGISMSSSGVSWSGIIYAPYGNVSISSSGDLAAASTLYAWQINLSGSSIEYNHTPDECPLEQATVKLLW